MNRNWIVFLAVPLWAMVSCSTGKPGEGFHPTDEPSLFIGVTVDADGRIKVSDDPALADRNKSAIRWKLDQSALNAGYRFASNGIAGDNKAVQPVCTTVGVFDNAFHNCKPKQGAEEFQCVRKPVFEPEACYKYVVTLVRPSGGSVPPPLDPWIKNDR